MLLAEQPADGAAAVAVDHRAGRARVDAELVLDAAAAHVVAGSVWQHFRHQEQRDSARPLRRVGQSRQHEMDDVVGEIVLAVADEDFLAVRCDSCRRPRGSARVRMALRSEPACGSVRFIVAVHSPATSLPR